MTTDPEHRPLLAVDVTMGDVWAIYDFRIPRLESLQRAHDGGTDEHRTAAALAEAVSGFVLEIEQAIRGPRRPRIARSSARPPAAVPAPVPTESERIANEKHRLTTIREYWNLLYGIVEVWRESGGYDLARWQRVGFLDAAAEAEYERRVADHGFRKLE